MRAKRNTPEGDRLDVLVTLVEAWERKHYPLDLPDPVEAIKYHMDQNGLQPRDLFLSSAAVTACTRCSIAGDLTLKMIYRLHEGRHSGGVTRSRPRRSRPPDAGPIQAYPKKQRPAGDAGRAKSRSRRMRRSSDRHLQVLGGAERDLLAGLDLDRLAGRGIAPHAGGALAHLQDAETRNTDALALLEVLGDQRRPGRPTALRRPSWYLVLLGEGCGEMLECDRTTGSAAWLP